MSRFAHESTPSSGTSPRWPRQASDSPATLNVRRRALVLSSVAGLLTPPAPAATAGSGATGFPARAVTNLDGISIEADPADGEYVGALIARLKAPQARAAASSQGFGIAELRGQREGVLRHLATRLALSGPTELMQQVFDKFSFSTGAIYNAVIDGRPRQFTLWRKADLVARLRAGQVIPGFTLEGDDVNVELNASFTAPPGTPADRLADTFDKAWQQLVWPVKIGIQSPAADIDASFQSLDQFRQAAIAAHTSSVMTVLHEVVEAALVSEYIRSADRRWFCEGLANWLALEEIRARVGDERAKQYYDIDALLARAGPGGFAELQKWPASESPDAKHYESELNEANYVRATSVMRQIAGKHGAEFIPKWLTEVRKTPAANADMQTVHAAFRKLTNEDLSTYLAGLTPGTVRR